jgi:hypothetical protein
VWDLRKSYTTAVQFPVPFVGPFSPHGVMDSGAGEPSVIAYMCVLVSHRHDTSQAYRPSVSIAPEWVSLSAQPTTRALLRQHILISNSASITRSLQDLLHTQHSAAPRIPMSESTLVSILLSSFMGS